MKKNLLNESIESYEQYVNKLPSGCFKIAEYLRNNEINLAMQNILNFSDGIIWISDMVEAIKQYGVNVPLDVTKVNDFLNQTNKALENKDYILVADLFEYEFAPFFESVNNSKNN